MRTYRNFFVMGVFIILLAGCNTTAGRDVELIYDPEDYDALRPSPCVCVEYTSFNRRFQVSSG